MRNEASRFASCVLALVTVLTLAMTCIPAASADEKTEAQGIVEKARITLGTFMADENFSWLKENIKNAKGILIYPQVLKAGFILGGSGGTGVLLAHDSKTASWSQPVFYTVGSVSFGLQIGGEAAQTIILVMTQKAVDSLYTSTVKLGADASVAVGPVGAGAKSDVMADFIAFSMSKGAYAGLNVEGSVVGVRDGLNKAYYGAEVSPVDIIVEEKVKNKGSAELRAALKKAAK